MCVGWHLSCNHGYVCNKLQSVDAKPGAYQRTAADSQNEGDYDCNNEDRENQDPNDKHFRSCFMSDQRRNLEVK